MRCVAMGPLLLRQAAVPVLVTRDKDNINQVIARFSAGKFPIMIGVSEAETVLSPARSGGRLLLPWFAAQPLSKHNRSAANPALVQAEISRRERRMRFSIMSSPWESVYPPAKKRKVSAKVLFCSRISTCP